MSTENTLGMLFQKLKKNISFNIGTVLFAALFIYMIISFLLYLTSSHFTSYQVVSGPLSRNATYTGLALHTEQVVSADTGGYINYYAREGSKVNASGIVYGISSQPLGTSELALEAEDLSKIRKQMSNFSYSFRPGNFNSTYSFKSELEGNILQYAGAADTGSTASDGDSSDENTDTTISSTAVTLGNQTLCRTQEDGIVLYSRDGYESITAENISEEDFDQNAYHKEDLKTRDAIEAGQDVYTIVTDERWSVYIPLTVKQATQLSDLSAIRVKFLKDNLTQVGSFSIVEIGDGKYGKLDFNNGLLRYVSDRFLDLELVTNTRSGLKIPLSAVLTKEFYLIPEGFLDNSGECFLVEKKGSDTPELVSASIYAKDEENGMYYVDKSVFEPGTVLIKEDSSERYVVDETGNLEGVYCINEGYAQFRRIVILDQNDEYCIVEKGTPYGLAQYDNIVYDSKDVNEKDILY